MHRNRVSFFLYITYQHKCCDEMAAVIKLVALKVQTFVSPVV